MNSSSPSFNPVPPGSITSTQLSPKRGSRSTLFTSAASAVSSPRMSLNQMCEKQIPRVSRDIIEDSAQHDMIPVLKAMKYIVDTLRANNVVWGVGRGSSVASYVLFIIGVHKIDSVKYKLPINEFFKGE